jgi:hypothetical protein
MAKSEGDKGKFASAHTLEACGREKMQLHSFLTSAFDEVVVSLTPGPLYLRGKSAWYPMNRWIDVPQNRSWRFGEDSNLLPLPGSRTTFEDNIELDLKGKG